MKTLYERLGSTEKITKIADDIIKFHLKNPTIATRYKAFDSTALKHGAATFIIAGTGGPDIYEGKDMITTHSHMNISDTEFNAVLDDILLVLDKHDVGQREKEEFLFILYGLKKEIVHI